MEESESSLEYACRNGFAHKLVEEYVNYCYSFGCTPKNEKTAQKTRKQRFPNLAGFCRYFGIGDTEYKSLKNKYPKEFERINWVFEDEALNAEVSPTIVSAYLKRRLGYEKSNESEIIDGELKVIFEHDIMEDGE